MLHQSEKCFFFSFINFQLPKSINYTSQQLINRFWQPKRFIIYSVGVWCWGYDLSPRLFELLPVWIHFANGYNRLKLSPSAWHRRSLQTETLSMCPESALYQNETFQRPWTCLMSNQNNAGQALNCNFGINGKHFWLASNTIDIVQNSCYITRIKRIVQIYIYKHFKCTKTSLKVQ